MSVSGATAKHPEKPVSLGRDYTLQFLKTTIRNSYFSAAKVSKPDGMISVLQTLIQLIQKMWPLNSHLGCSYQRSKKIEKWTIFSASQAIA